MSAWSLTRMYGRSVRRLQDGLTVECSRPDSNPNDVSAAPGTYIGQGARIAVDARMVRTRDRGGTGSSPTTPKLTKNP